MKYFKIVCVFVLAVVSGSCNLFIPTTTYYYVVSSGCSYHGDISYNTSSGTFYDPSIPLTYYVTKAYKFDKGTLIGVAAGVTAESYLCLANNITVSIMKGTTAEGSVGNGGTVWRTATAVGAAFVNGTAD